MSQIFKNKNTWFSQDKSTLIHFFNRMIQNLEDLNRSKKDIEKYKKAYNFFTEKPDKYDGSTFVADQPMFIKSRYCKLDINSMLHDYESITFASFSFKAWFISAWDYVENIRKCGGWYYSHWQFLGLLAIGVPFVTYRKFIKIIIKYFS